MGEGFVGFVQQDFSFLIPTNYIEGIRAAVTCSGRVCRWEAVFVLTVRYETLCGWPVTLHYSALGIRRVRVDIGILRAARHR